MAEPGAMQHVAQSLWLGHRLNGLLQSVADRVQGTCPCQPVHQVHVRGVPASATTKHPTVNPGKIRSPTVCPECLCVCGDPVPCRIGGLDGQSMTGLTEVRSQRTIRTRPGYAVEEQTLDADV